ncbi:phage baseplate protein [uncultured Selenomonas sp.]|uniref:phage baseplate protein n=1 Tax=uncultured Selenomonas sp. TaxID=159275 RepID=UPI0028DCD796|nr:hypothetical protein [uncultured Selenomonas sp.]
MPQIQSEEQQKARLIHTEQTQIGENLLVDVVLSRETAFESEVTENPVEDGFVVADHVRRRPLTLSMECVFTPTPVTFDAVGNPGFRMNNVADEIMKIYKAGEPVEIKTPDAIYKNMVMLTSPLVRNVQNGFCYRMQMTFKHVRMVNQRKEDIPADDASDEASGKAGATETDGGVANETDIGTGMTSRGGKAVPEVATDSVDRNCSGDYQTGNEMTANVAALSIAACLLGGGASFWRD